jgi:hypothetical protein
MFRFTIRDVLWLTVVVALGVGWFVERWRNEQVREEAYLQGAADDNAVWLHQYNEYRENVSKSLERVRERYNIPYPALPDEPN